VQTMIAQKVPLVKPATARFGPPGLAAQTAQS
jgi:hypothetical protein